jgi:hypothetical protein
MTANGAVQAGEPQTCSGPPVRRVKWWRVLYGTFMAGYFSLHVLAAINDPPGAGKTFFISADLLSAMAGASLMTIGFLSGRMDWSKPHNNDSISI